MSNAAKTRPQTVERRILALLDAQRRDRGLTQREVAEHVGISQGQVSRILAGQFPASLTEVMRICEIVGMSLSDAVSAAEAEYAGSGDGAGVRPVTSGATANKSESIAPVRGQ